MRTTSVHLALLDTRETKIRAPRKRDKWYGGLQYDADVGGALEALKNIGKYYPGATKYEVAGFLFWQGAKDSGNTNDANNYERNLVFFINDLRKDFDAPKAPFVCATMGHAKKGGKGRASIITDAQLAVDGKKGKYPEFKGNVATFYSHPVSKGGSANSQYGGNPETYMNVGEGMGAAMVELVKKNQSSATAGNSNQKSQTISLSEEQKRKLSELVKSTLIEMSKKGELKKLSLTISKTRARVWLVEAKEDGRLTFQLFSGTKKATFNYGDLSKSDHLILSRLIAALNPEDPLSQAIAGTSLASVGNKRLAESYFKKSNSNIIKNLIESLK